MLEPVSFGITPEQASSLVRGLAKRGCYIMTTENGRTVVPEAEHHQPSAPVQVVSDVPRIGHEGRGAPPPGPPRLGLQAKATDTAFPGIHTGTYRPGALIDEIKKATADVPLKPPEKYVAPDSYPMDLRIRTGRTGSKLPPVPGTDDRLRERPFRRGDVERVLHEKVAQGISPLESVAAGAIAQGASESEDAEVPEGADKIPFNISRAGSMLDYAGRAALGVGLGKTIGSLAKGPMREAMERRLGGAGALLGLSLAMASQRESRRKMEAGKALRVMAQEQQRAMGEDKQLTTADAQIRALLEGGARADGARV
jgi:hypothetical protein